MMCQPHCVDAAYDREKSATREAVDVLSEFIGCRHKGNAPKFSIVKLPVRGVVLLIWQRRPEQPRPTAVVAELITSIYAKTRSRLKSVALAQHGNLLCVGSLSPMNSSSVAVYWMTSGERQIT